MFRALLVGVICFCGCASPDAPEPPASQLRGTLQPKNAAPGDAYVFLYSALDGPLPKGTGRPVQLSAIPEPRGFQGAPPDADYVFAQVPPGAYLASAVIDSRKLFSPFIEVLAQPFAGDAVLGPASVSLTAGANARLDLTGGATANWDPPMFTVDEPSGGALQLTPGSTAFTLMHLRIDPLPFAQNAAFLYGTADADGDGQLDDFNGDGIADAYPEVLLRRIPDPSDGPEFSWPDGGALDIVIPAVTAQPDPLGRNQSFGTQQAVNGIYALIPPTAFIALGPDATGRPRTRRLPSLPVGHYSVTVIQSTGQFWQVPNGLSPGAPLASERGGPFASQSVNVQVVDGP